MVLIDSGLFIRNEYFTYQLTDAEEILYQNYFSDMPRPIFCELIRIADYQKLNPGELLIKENTHPEKVYFLLEGTVNVIKNSIIINKLASHSFIGEMSFLTKNPANADVAAKTQIQVLSWDKKTLEKHAHIRDYYNLYLAIDLTHKIKSTEEFKKSS